MGPVFLTPHYGHYGPSPEHVILGAVVLGFAILLLFFRRRPVILTYGWGTVYIFRDVSNPQLLKVGMTRRSSSIRLAEVSETMTGGLKLEHIYGVKVPYVKNVEALAHLNLKSKRLWSDRGTEWFKTDERTAIRAVDRAARQVRKLARQQRKWSPQADQTASRWKMTRNGPVEGRLF